MPRQTAQTAKPPTAPRRPLWFVVLLVLPAICCTAALVVVSRRPAELCRQWEQQARSAAGSTVAQAVEQLDRYGEYGLPALVRLLGSQNSEAVTAAQQVLSRRLPRWQPAASASDRRALEVVAAELSATFSQRTDPAPRETVDWALQLMSRTGKLDLDYGLDAGLRTRLLAACDEVLRRAPPPLEAPAVPLAAMLPTKPSAPSVATPTVAAPAVIVEPAPAAPAPRVAVKTPAEPVPPPTPLPAANAAARINPIRQLPSDPAVRPASLPSPVSRTLRAMDRPPADDSPQVDAWTLFARLGGEQREAAAAELQRRGFSAREIQLGERLTSSDPAIRRRHAQELPSLGVTEAKPWLLRLCQDEDAEVRRIVAAIMATTGDPALQQVLRRMSLEDADDEVRRTAARATGRTR